MTAAVFVDTNVFVYARDASEAMKQPRAAWLERLWRDQLGRTSAQVLSEYYVSVTRKLVPGLPPDVAWDDLSALFTWRPQPIDETLLQRGREIEQRHRLQLVGRRRQRRANRPVGDRNVMCLECLHSTEH